MNWKEAKFAQMSLEISKGNAFLSKGSYAIKRNEGISFELMCDISFSNLHR